mgnify:CR=1 FL=1
MLCIIGCAITGLPPLFSDHDWAAALARTLAPLGAIAAAILIGGHCDGGWIDRSDVSFNDRALAVQVPAGFQGAKPQPKPGWTVAIRKAQLAKPYTSHGKTVTDDVVEVRWTAASKEAALPDEQFDDFAFMGRLPDQPGPVWVKVLQICDSGQNDWSEIPAQGTSTKGLKLPAALLDVQPAPAHEHHH